MIKLLAVAARNTGTVSKLYMFFAARRCFISHLAGKTVWKMWLVVWESSCKFSASKRITVSVFPQQKTVNKR